MFLIAGLEGYPPISKPAPIHGKLSHGLPHGRGMELDLPPSQGTSKGVYSMRVSDGHRMSKCCLKILSGKNGKHETLQDTD